MDGTLFCVFKRYVPEWNQIRCKFVEMRAEHLNMIFACFNFCSEAKKSYYFHYIL